MKKYIPKAGEKFRAFLRVEKTGKEHFGSPFHCIEVNLQRVLAIDRLRLKCNLKMHDFSFKPMNKETEN